MNNLKLSLKKFLFSAALIAGSGEFNGLHSQEKLAEIPISKIVGGTNVAIENRPF